jgi:pimeloyl-ACP methyl ester carboxylesterase
MIPRQVERMIDFAEHIFDLSSARIHAIQYGDRRKTPLLLLPCWPMSGRIFLLLEPYLADRFHVTSIDLPGWMGRSTFVGGHKHCIMDYVQIVGDTIEAIYPHHKKIYLGGVSLGGTLALLVTRHLRKRIRKVVIQSSPYNGFVLRKGREQKYELAKRAQSLPILRKILKAYYKHYLITHYEQYKDKIGNDIIGEMQVDYEQMDPADVMGVAVDVCSLDLSRLCEQISNQVVVIGCGDETYVPPRWMQTLAYDILPHATYVEIPHADHYVLAENPRALGMIIREYL